MNMLFPRKLAEPATLKAIADLERRMKNLAVEREVQEDLLEKNLEEMKGKVITISAKADEKGHLFSGIHSKELVDEMKKQHHADISAEYIILDKPIKQTGEFQVPIEIKNKKSWFKLVIQPV
jgi:large subunit ribosomal protein L9